MKRVPEATLERLLFGVSGILNNIYVFSELKEGNIEGPKRDVTQQVMTVVTDFLLNSENREVRLGFGERKFKLKLEELFTEEERARAIENKMAGRS